MSEITPGREYATKASGRTIIVRVIEAEQDVHRDRQWICVNVASGRILRRTAHKLQEVTTEDAHSGETHSGRQPEITVPPSVGSGDLIGALVVTGKGVVVTPPDGWTA